MCWIGKRDSRKIATEDIRVFKVVEAESDGSYKPYYFGDSSLRYRIGKKAESEIHLMPAWGHRDDFASITAGLHSYTSKRIRLAFVPLDRLAFAPLSDQNRIFGYYAIIGKTGLISAFFDVEKIAFLEMLIPEGSSYYENEIGEMVSDCLIPIRDITKEIEKVDMERLCDIIPK